MNVMKQSAAELESHLGKDMRGIKLLGNVVRAANEIRTSLAAATQKLDAKHEAIQRLRAQLDDCRLIAESRRQQLENAENTIRNQQTTIAEQQNTIAKLDAALDPPLDVLPESKLANRTRFKQLFKALRVELPAPPDPIAPPARPPYTFELTDFVTEYNGAQYTRLGMFVVVCCVLNWPVAFSLAETTNKLDFGLKEYHGGEIGKFVRWMHETWMAKRKKWEDILGLKMGTDVRSVSDRGEFR